MMSLGTIATLQRQAELRNNDAFRSTQDLVGFGAPLLHLALARRKLES